MADAKLVMATVKTSIEAINVALGRYDNLLTRFAPWKQFKSTLVDLDKLPKNISAENAAQVRKIKTDTLNGIDEYFDAFKNSSEWAVMTEAYIEEFISLFHNHNARNAETQKRRLIELLDNSVAQMTTTEAGLNKSARSLNSAGALLAIWQKKFGPNFHVRKDEFKNNVNKFPMFPKGADMAQLHKLLDEMAKVTKKCDDLYVKVKEALGTVDHAKDILKTEIQHISYLKKKTEQTVHYVNLDQRHDLRNMIVQLGQNLIVKCKDYRNKYAD